MHAIAADAVRQLARVYPPEHTQLSFAHPVGDAFGRPFVTALRVAGFAVAEEGAKRGSHLAIAYVADEVGPLYRVIVRTTSAHRKLHLTRAYTHQADGLRPAGGWTQQVAP